MKKTNYKTGHFAEKIGLWYLRLKGYHCLARNHITGKGTGAGEIDLIMKKGETLVFVEVKKRKNLTTAAEAITSKNQQRTARAAEVFIKTHPNLKYNSIRFDAIIFDSSFIPHHIKDAWRL